MSSTLHLIGGTSHTGKTARATELSRTLGIPFLSTDYLAKHPGRPWRNPPEEVPPNVAEHYRTLAPGKLLANMLDHYRLTVWPLVLQVLADYQKKDRAVIVEGSAVLPGLVAALELPNAEAHWLTASEGTLQRRIYAAANYPTRTPPQCYLVDKFLTRTLRFNTYLREQTAHYGYELET
ncbi:hypothetical protein [Neolewinella sp.]|uniref:hypothetical protein n=1 Tax=Neolewinella sp. TaxID=2993543 RepID=UPI003B52E595